MWGVLVPLAVLGLLFVAVDRGGDEVRAPSQSSPTVFVPTFERLPPVPDGHYELWVARPDGGEERIAAFSVLPGGTISALNGEGAREFLVRELPPPGSVLLLTVEEGRDPLTSRSDRLLLRGALSAADVTFEPVLPRLEGSHVAQLRMSSGAASSKRSGLWFSGERGQGLQLPPLSGGWAYGGFVTLSQGTRLATGLFHDPGRPDMATPHTKSNKGVLLPFPGEDFVHDPPEGVTFPLNLADGRTTVSVALQPDFSSGGAEPFLPLLEGRIPYRLEPREPFPLEAVRPETFPKGTGTFAQKGS